MKRSPIRRVTGVRPRRPGPPRRSGRARDRAYLAWVHTLPCCARAMGPCAGVIEADHAGRRPYGRKCDDREAIPLCTWHHRQRTDFTGPFRDWSGGRMREWLNLQIAITQAEWEVQHRPGAGMRGMPW